MVGLVLVIVALLDPGSPLEFERCQQFGNSASMAALTDDGVPKGSEDGCRKDGHCRRMRLSAKCPPPPLNDGVYEAPTPLPPELASLRPHVRRQAAALVANSQGRLGASPRGHNMM